MNKQDFKTALKSMGGIAKSGLTELMQFLVTGIGLCAIGFILGYCFFHYFFQSITVLGMIMLCTWFWIELDNAKKIREKEEQQEAYWAEKSKPMHEAE